MSKRHFVTTILRLLLLVSLLLTIVITVTATGWAGNNPKKHPAKQMTDAAGRTHVRPAPRISDAQRKAAAQRRKALRAKGAQTAAPRTGRVR